MTSGRCTSYRRFPGSLGTHTVDTTMCCMQEWTNEQLGSQAARELEEQVQQLYGGLLRGPKGQRQSEGLSLSVSSPEGSKALGEGIRLLLERHVQFIHQGHHHLLPVRPQSKPVLAALRMGYWILHGGGQPFATTILASRC